MYCHHTLAIGSHCGYAVFSSEALLSFRYLLLQLIIVGP
jgi:hypothetical protein